MGTRDRRAILRICYGSVASGGHKSHEFCIRDQMDFENRKMPQNEQQQPKSSKSDVNDTDLV